MIKYSTPLSKEQINSAKLIAENCGIMQDTAVLLLTRNIDTIDKAQHFLNPSKSGFHSPFIMSDMQQGVERILRAKHTMRVCIEMGYFLRRFLSKNCLRSCS